MPWDPLSRVIGDLLATTDCVEIEESKGILSSRKIEELSIQFANIQVAEHKVFLGSGAILYDFVMVGACHYTFVKICRM